MSLKRIEVGNNGRASLLSSITANALTFQLYENSSAEKPDKLAGIPAGTDIVFILTIEDELILCSARTGGTVTVYEEDVEGKGFLAPGENGRGYGDSSPASHLGDKQAEVRNVAQIIEKIYAGIEDTETGLADRYTKAEVDVLLGSKNTKDEVEAATTGNITLSGEQTVDDVPLTSGQRVLVKNQTDPKENGIYDVATGAWSRSSDADTTEKLDAALVPVKAGTSNKDSFWVQTTDDPEIGTDNIVFAQIGQSLEKATNADAAAGTDDSKYTTVAKVVHLLGNLVNTVFTYFIATRATKSTIVGADIILIGDSADSNKDKKNTVINFLKNTRKNGAQQKSVATPSDTLNIAHGLPGVPNWVKINASMTNAGLNTEANSAVSFGEKNGTVYSLMRRGSNYDVSGIYRHNSGFSTTKIIELQVQKGSTTITVSATVTLTDTEIQLSFLNDSAVAEPIYFSWEVGF